MLASLEEGLLNALVCGEETLSLGETIGDLAGLALVSEALCDFCCH